MNAQEARERLFIGVYPCGIVYADKAREEHGDYKKLGFLSYKTLELDVRDNCPVELRLLIEDDASEIQAKRGEQFQTSTCGQTVLLGE